MTRIIAGSARGRRLQVPKSGTRPTSDRVRESLFAMLDHRFGGDWHDLRVLDLFAGTGAFGLEALSRGAVAAVAVERHAATSALIRRNAADCGLPLQVVTADALTWVRQSQPAFDLVFADPPYEMPNSELELLLERLSESGLVAAGGLVLIERSSRSEPLEAPDAVTGQEQRRFGDTVVEVQVW